MPNRRRRNRNRDDESQTQNQQQHPKTLFQRSHDRNCRISNPYSNFSNDNPFQRKPQRRGTGGIFNSNSDFGPGSREDLFSNHSTGRPPTHNPRHRNQNQNQFRNPFSPNDQRAFILRSQETKRYLLKITYDVLGWLDTWYPDEVMAADEMDWQPENELVIPQPPFPMMMEESVYRVEHVPSSMDPYADILQKEKGKAKKASYVWNQAEREFREPAYAYQQRANGYTIDARMGVGMGMGPRDCSKPRSAGFGDTTTEGEYSFCPASSRLPRDGIRYPHQEEVGR